MNSKQLFILICCIGLFQLACTPNNNQHHLEVAGVESPEILLNGTWKFSMAPPEKFWENEVDVKNWNDIEVPGECQMQGFAIKHDTPYVYKTVFAVPKDFAGKQIHLNFYGVYSYARIWVNGTLMREHYGGFTKWECDVTDVVEAGEKAILTVEFTDRSDDISYGSGYAKHQIGGILRDVELTALPKQNFKQLYFETDLDDNYEHAELKVFYELRKEILSRFEINLLDAEGKMVVNTTEITKTKSGSIAIPIKNPLKWDAEHPNLYTVVTTLFEDDREILKTQQQIGFREVEVSGNQMLVNGKQVKLRGACRHDIHPTLGRMTTPFYDLQDVLLAKECNMNFIRTSHYPPSEQFLDYCDEYGIYVEDETAICFVGSHRTEAYRATGATQSDPQFTERYLSQLEEMVQHHRNHPSVVIWSIGNENVFGSNFVEEYKWVKQHDMTRPVIFSYPGNVPDSLKMYDIISMHYPNWRGNLNQHGIKTTGFESPEMPMLFDEWAHVACYNNFELRDDPNVRNFWGQSLDSMWAYTFEAEGALGGAIWCMLDETFMLPEDLDGFNKWWGILDKNIIPATYKGPTVGYGEWGILDTWRRKKPEFWGTKKAYSPARIMIKQVDIFEAGKELIVPMHNRFDHTNFDELMIAFEYGKDSGRLDNVYLEPHEKGELRIPAQQWEAGSALTITFYNKNKELIDTYNIRIGSPSFEMPELRKGKIEVKEEEGVIAFLGEDVQLQVNKNTGLLQHVVSNQDTLIKSGPYINLKIPGNRVQYSTIEMDDYAKNWKLDELHYEVLEGILNVQTRGSYDSIKVTFNIQVDADGHIFIDYAVSNAPDNKMTQEEGVKFMMGEQFNSLSWDRDAYFTAYPDLDLGMAQGTINLKDQPKMEYRSQPKHAWAMDNTNYYYYGLTEKMPYTVLARSLKENIYNYTLSTANSSINVLSEGSLACRFDRIDGKNTLIINKQWDYQSLLWGNYMKMIKSSDKFTGQVMIKVNNIEF